MVPKQIAGVCRVGVLLFEKDASSVISLVEKGPNFAPGQLVRHVRYGYRAVVVAIDPYCRAGEAWYQSNQTQPTRNQPWYHLLVHRTDTTTYAAQHNLTPDPDNDPIEHPLLEMFFDRFSDGSYERNKRAWVL